MILLHLFMTSNHIFQYLTSWFRTALGICKGFSALTPKLLLAKNKTFSHSTNQYVVKFQLTWVSYFPFPLP